MSNSKPRPLRVLRNLALIAVVGALVTPVLAYFVGTALGPYEGEGGLAGYVLSVFGAAFEGGAAAWGLLLSPALFVALWWSLIRLIGLGRPTGSDVETED